ncbi:MAG: metal-dependent transcriptional regulator [Oscillochloris sp.]|nr:metal-dependent transcriptional regulator [Oscillochloris sp.]
MSESVEMYLVKTAILRQAPEQPVAVTLLARELGVTQVSANEMCRKLHERGLLSYQPYKGVTLTEAGEAQAQQILSRRRLWVMFLVESLGIEFAEADELACQLEHITSERLVNALTDFLEHGPNAYARDGARRGRILNTCTAGAWGQIAMLELEPATAAFLSGQGITPNVTVEVLAVGADGAVLLNVDERRIALAPTIAAQIRLNPVVRTIRDYFGNS